MVMELSKSKQSIYSQLSKRKMRERYRLFIVEGYKSVGDIIGLFEIEAVIAVTGIIIPDNWNCAGKIFEVSPSTIKKISSLSTPPDVIAIFHIPENNKEDNIPAPDLNKLYLLLDGIQDPGNMGTILRTAHWFGIDRIYASKDTVDIYNPKTIQSTMGSLGKVEVIYCDLASLISSYPDIPVYGTLLAGENIYKATLKEHGFIIMGNEGNGISEELRALVSFPLLIPPYSGDNHPESLNVGIATAVTLSQFRSR